MKRRCCREGSTSSISFQPWLLPNSCSLFIYFNISLVAQAAAHSLTPAWGWGCVTAGQGHPELSLLGRGQGSTAVSSICPHPRPGRSQLSLGKPSALPGARSAGQAGISALCLCLHAEIPAKVFSFPAGIQPRLMLSLTSEGSGGRGCPAPPLVPQTAQEGHSSGPSGRCCQPRDPFVHFLFSSAHRACSRAQFVSWLRKPSQTPWLISTKEEVENTLCLLSQSTALGFLQPREPKAFLSPLPSQPPLSHFHFPPGSLLHQEGIKSE